MEGKLIDFNSVSGQFEAYASVFGNLDQTGDIVERSAFAKTVKDAEARRKANGGRFLWPLLHMHNQASAIGGIESAIEDAHGLKIRGVVDVSTPAGQSAYSGLKSGYVSQFSIGYDTVRSFRDAKHVRHLTEIKLWEISLITLGFAANELANVDQASVKAFDPLAAAIERLRAVITGERGAGRATRPSAGAGGATEPPEPQPGDFVSDAKYRAAMDEWVSDISAVRYSRALPSQAEVNRAAFERSVAADTARRLATGQATVKERMDAAPDDPALRERVERAGRAMRELLATSADE